MSQVLKTCSDKVISKTVKHMANIENYYSNEMRHM